MRRILSLLVVFCVVALMGAPAFSKKGNDPAAEQAKIEKQQANEAAKKAKQEAKEAEKKAKAEAAAAKKEAAVADAKAKKEAKEAEKATKKAKKLGTMDSYDGDTWEYKAIRLKLPKNAKWLDRWNELGAHGWQLAGQMDETYIFVRQVAKGRSRSTSAPSVEESQHF